MPVSPEFGADLAAASAQLVADAELAILRLIAARLRAGTESPQWADHKLGELRLLRARLTRELTGLDADLATMVTDTMKRAYTEGQAFAVGNLDDAGVAPALPPARAAAMDAIATDVITRVTGLTPTVLRTATDAYQQAVGESLGGVLLGAQTRTQTAQRVLDRLLGQGIGAFTDKAGRQWRLESYVEMAVRTGAGQASIAGHVETLVSSGQDLVHIIPGPRSCGICDHWAGKVLSLTGATTSYLGPGGRSRVAGTLDDARAAGWGHPNCRCSTGIFLPGFTRTTTQRPDPRGYELQQRQRTLERRVRAAKRKAALSLDDARARVTDLRVRQAQADVRAHLAAHPELKRQSRREQVGRAI